MEEFEFFKLYIPALEKALSNKETNNELSAKGPDWWYPDAKYNDMDSFETKNINKYSIFEKAALYFDAKAHNFKKINGVDISLYKEIIIGLINEYKERFGLKNSVLD
ncbi:MAG: hypothetical protein LBL90_09360 [Prevotellaceae bacterium]|jgi:hypothetical protein|nr:hypothetical protein [Prevotellaceae bacterium]